MRPRLVLPTLSFLLAASLAAPPAALATRLVRVELTPERPVERLLEAGLDVIHFKRGATADVLLAPGDLEALRRLGATPVTLDDNVEHSAAERAAAELAAAPRPAPTRVRSAVRPDGAYRIEVLPAVGSGSMGGFWTLDEVKMKLDQLVADDTHDVVAAKIDTIGTSLQGRPIWGLKIGRTVVGPDPRPVVFFNALTHAREPEGMQALFWFVDDLLAGADVDPSATYLLDQRVLYIVPVTNPDGYRFNQAQFPGGGGQQRKNLRDTDNNATADYNTDGIDLNRNFGFMWGLNNVGSSGSVTNQTYRGPAAFSEPETQAIRDKVIALQPKTGLSFHTFSEVFVHPWGFTPTATADSASFYEWNDEAMAGGMYVSGPAPRILYEVNGEFNDWMYGDTLAKPRGFSWTPEIGLDTDGFWPAPSRIVPLAKENLRACYTVLGIAGACVRAESATLPGGPLHAGMAAFLRVRARNMGLAATPAGLTGTLVSLDPGIATSVASVGYPALAARTSGDPSGGGAFIVSADDTVTAGRLARFEVRFEAPGGFSMRDTVEVLVGAPTVLSIDPANDLTNWANLATWGVISGDPAHPSRYFADSPSGNYGANASLRLVRRASVNLSAGVHAWLELDAKWLLEGAYDGTLLEASLDSVIWVPMAGRNMLPGIYAPQPSAKPIWQGARWNWTPERVDLSPMTGAAGAAVRLRFRTVSDVGAQFAGFHADSIRILVFDPNAQPVPTAVDDAPAAALWLSAPLPNPARATTQLAFALPRAGRVRLDVLDVQGRRVRTLADASYGAGRWALAWDLADDAGRGVAPGIYFTRLEGPGGVRTRRLVVLR